MNDGRELVGTVATGSDAALLDAIGALNSFEASPTTPATLNSIIEDLEELLHAVRLGATSKPYFIVGQAAAKAIAAKMATAGIATFGATGGSLLGIEALVSDAWTDRISLIDARALAIAQAPIELRSSDTASVEMSATPSNNAATATGAQLVSMLQTNCRAIIAERSLSILIVRPSAVASLSGVVYGGTGGSPTSF